MEGERLDQLDRRLDKWAADMHIVIEPRDVAPKSSEGSPTSSNRGDREGTSLNQTLRKLLDFNDIEDEGEDDDLVSKMSIEEQQRWLSDESEGTLKDLCTNFIAAIDSPLSPTKVVTILYEGVQNLASIDAMRRESDGLLILDSMREQLGDTALDAITYVALHADKLLTQYKVLQHTLQNSKLLQAKPTSEGKETHHQQTFFHGGTISTNANLDKARVKLAKKVNLSNPKFVCCHRCAATLLVCAVKERDRETDDEEMSSILQMFGLLQAMVPIREKYGVCTAPY